MKHLILSLIAAATIVSASPVTTTTVTLTGAGSPPVVQKIGSEGVYIGPYTLEIDGRSVAAMCIDFADESKLDSSWNADLTPLSHKNLDHTYHPDSKTQYLEEAYLFDLITKPGVSSSDRTSIQDAAWYIFDPSAVKGVMNSRSYSFYNASVHNASTEDPNRFQIVSSVNPYCDRQQEFITATATPEPATYLLMGCGLVVSGLLSRRRRQN